MMNLCSDIDFEKLLLPCMLGINPVYTELSDRQPVRRFNNQACIGSKN